ncbi:murein biosynthesis integral membrane protein MurJ [Cellulomonas fimi]|uniref:Virulence factor MviN n=1 Tax=Cellulomonas fimi TaxID=1708 RepID=A0A7Y0M040_CELFI|nr:lipid II flippase MurJ [Cellulomonas fimi]NMR21417.1 virulence factor MviN [Cellulomonas fimi]
MSPAARRALTGLAGAAALVAAITVASRVVGFGRWFAQSWAVGATPTGSAYATANTLPNVLFEVVAGGALAGAVVPLLAGPLAKGLRGDVDRIASALLTWSVAVLLPASVFLAAVARPVVEVLIDPVGGGGETGATHADTVALASRLLVIFAPQVVLYGIGVVLTGVLQAQRRFVWPAAAPLASSVVVITSYLVFRSLAGTDVRRPGELSASAVTWLGWGTTAGVAAMSLPLIVPVLRSGVRLRPTFAFPSGVARRARNLALAGLGGLLAQQVAVLVTVRLANGYGDPDGTLNLFQYAQAVYFLPYAVLAVPLATVAFPRLAQHAATGDQARYARLVAGSTRVILLVSAAGAAALVAAAPAVTAVFATVDASADPARLTPMTPTLVALAPGLLGYALIFQLSRVLFALERGRAAVIGVVSGWGAVVVTSLVAVRLLAPGGGDGAATLLGLGLGNTIGMTVAGVALLVAVRRSAGAAALSGVPRTLVVVLVGAGIGAVAGRWLVGDVLDLVGPGFPTTIAAGLGGAALSTLVVVALAWLADRSTVSAGLLSDSSEETRA